MLYLIGNKHVYTHITLPRRHSYTHQPMIKILDHIILIVILVIAMVATIQYCYCFDHCFEQPEGWALPAAGPCGHAAELPRLWAAQDVLGRLWRGGPGTIGCLMEEPKRLVIWPSTSTCIPVRIYLSS